LEIDEIVRKLEIDDLLFQRQQKLNQIIVSLHQRIQNKEINQLQICTLISFLSALANGFELKKAQKMKFCESIFEECEKYSSL
jgi:hypothetical protein